jgi:serine/threonine protein kinase
VALIALIDSSPETLASTARELQQQGHEVLSFRDPIEALEALALESKLALLITRLDNEGLDGLELSRRVLARRAAPLPIILGAQKPTEALVEQGIQAGLSDVLSYPFERNRLLSKVFMILRSAQLKAPQALDETAPVAPPTPEDVPLPSPRRHFGSYELIDELGRGGMGTVYRACHRVTKALVALKILHMRSDDAKVLGRFEREIKILEELQSPNVVRVLDAGCEGNSHFLAMELVEGVSAKEQLEKHGPFSSRDLLRVLEGVSKALDALVRHDLIHRDVKPANILLANEGEIKLVDFGLAKHHSDQALTHTGEALGTPYYLSPEVIRGGEADIRSDIYALGITLSELATGEKPFQGATAIEVFRNIFYAPAPLITDKRPDIPPPVVRLIKTMMARIPRDRPESPAKVLEELELAQRRLRSSTDRLPERLSQGENLSPS